jgi:hypothetical protein
MTQDNSAGKVVKSTVWREVKIGVQPLRRKYGVKSFGSGDMVEA